MQCHTIKITATLISSITCFPCLALVLPHIWGSEVTDSDTKHLHAFLSLCTLNAIYNDRYSFPVHCLMSSVQRSVVFLDVCFRRWCRVEHDCVHRLSAHGRSIVAFFFWLLPGNDMSASAPLLVLCSVCSEAISLWTTWFCYSFPPSI